MESNTEARRSLLHMQKKLVQEQTCTQLQADFLALIMLRCWELPQDVLHGLASRETLKSVHIQWAMSKHQPATFPTKHPQVSAQAQAAQMYSTTSNLQ